MLSVIFCKTEGGPLIPQRAIGWLQGIRVVQQDRSKLRFVEAVQVNFRFLEERCGLKCVWVEPTLVRYEAKSIFINVYHSRSSFEIDMEVGRLDGSEEDENGYSLTEIFKLISRERDERWYFASRDPAGIVVGVKRMSEVFKRCADQVFSKPDEFLACLRKQREAWKRSFALEVIAKQTRPKAEIAFQKKKYAEAARLYESIREALTPVEFKKLEYAKRQVG